MEGLAVRKFLGFLGVILVSGCSTGSVIQAGPDTYSVTSTGAGFSTDGVRSKVYDAANEYCAKKNLVMIEASLDIQSGSLGRHPPNADLKFRCLKSGDPEISRRASGVQGVMIGALPVSDKPANTENKYVKLKQLKELLDSGILTQKEFDAQKIKILAE
jgi:hypothetical protein